MKIQLMHQIDTIQFKTATFKIFRYLGNLSYLMLLLMLIQQVLSCKPPVTSLTPVIFTKTLLWLCLFVFGKLLMVLLWLPLKRLLPLYSCPLWIPLTSWKERSWMMRPIWWLHDGYYCFILTFYINKSRPCVSCVT